MTLYTEYDREWDDLCLTYQKKDRRRVIHRDQDALNEAIIEYIIDQNHYVDDSWVFAAFLRDYVLFDRGYPTKTEQQHIRHSVNHIVDSSWVDSEVNLTVKGTSFGGRVTLWSKLMEL